MTQVSKRHQTLPACDSLHTYLKEKMYVEVEMGHVWERTGEEMSVCVGERRKKIGS